MPQFGSPAAYNEWGPGEGRLKVWLKDCSSCREDSPASSHPPGS